MVVAFGGPKYSVYIQFLGSLEKNHETLDQTRTQSEKVGRGWGFRAVGSLWFGLVHLI